MQLDCQLSYMVRWDGLEPSASALSEQCSNQLSYQRIDLQQVVVYNRVMRGVSPQSYQD